MLHEVSLLIRAPHAGDGAGLAQTWLDAASYYRGLNPDLFQLPEIDGLTAYFEGWALNTTSEHTLALVAEQHEQVIGFLSATIHQPFPEAKFEFVRDVGVVRLVIDVLVVQQACWRHGIGTQLLTAAEEWGKRQGAVIALVDTYINSPVSVPFYEQHMGYVRRTIRFHKPLS